MKAIIVAHEYTPLDTPYEFHGELREWAKTLRCSFFARSFSVHDLDYPLPDNLKPVVFDNVFVLHEWHEDDGENVHFDVYDAETGAYLCDFDRDEYDNTNLHITDGRVAIYRTHVTAGTARTA